MTEASAPETPRTYRTVRQASFIGGDLQVAATGRMPPLMSHRVGATASVGLPVAAALSLVPAIGFDLTAIANRDRGAPTTPGSPTLEPGGAAPTAP